MLGTRSAKASDCPVLHGGLHTEAAVEMLSLAERRAYVCTADRPP